MVSIYKQAQRLHRFASCSHLTAKGVLPEAAQDTASQMCFGPYCA